MKSSKATILLVLIALAGAAITARSAEPAIKQPNVVFILADDLGAHDLGCYGSTFYETPNIDRLSKSGVQFTRAYAAAPICSPTRAAILTGKYPARLHLTDWLPGRKDMRDQKLARPIINQRLSPEHPTLAALFKKHGYATGLIGKWHLGGGAQAVTNAGFDSVWMTAQSGKPDDETLTDRLTDRAETFIRSNATNRFFLYLGHHAPHIPLVAKQDLIERYRKKNPGTHQTNWVYAAVLHDLDQSVGRIVALLKELKLDENTVVIFTSDNGGLAVKEGRATPATSNHPLRASKGYLYEGGLRVPLLVRWPGQFGSASVNTVAVHSSDFLPTFQQLLGEPATQVDGISLLSNTNGASSRSLFWHYPHYSNQGGRPGSAILDGSLKLIECFETGRLEMYDLAKDPSETNNIANQIPAKRLEMAKRLGDWRTAAVAQMMQPNPAFDPENALPEIGVIPPASKTNVVLHARDVTIHGSNLRYEPQTNKNTIGYWTKVDDRAEWRAEIPTGGKWDVEVLQGCGKGSGGAEVEIHVGDERVNFIVEDTGHFQNFIWRRVGSVEVAKPGVQTIAVKPLTKAGAAVMDLRQLVLKRTAD